MSLNNKLKQTIGAIALVIGAGLALYCPMALKETQYDYLQNSIVQQNFNGPKSSTSCYEVRFNEFKEFAEKYNINYEMLKETTSTEISDKKFTPWIKNNESEKYESLGYRYSPANEEYNGSLQNFF